MKRRVALLALLLALALAQPAAAQPRDPESFQYPHRACAASRGDCSILVANSLPYHSTHR